MEGNYEIYFGGQSVGVAEVCREGLYYRFRCRCRLTGEILYRITVTVEGREESLGIPVPERGEFCLNVRLPVKRFGQGMPSFRVLPKHEPVSGQFVPIRAEEPFQYLSRIKNAHLETHGNQIGIYIEN